MRKNALAVSPRSRRSISKRSNAEIAVSLDSSTVLPSDRCHLRGEHVRIGIRLREITPEINLTRFVALDFVRACHWHHLKVSATQKGSEQDPNLPDTSSFGEGRSGRFELAGPERIRLDELVRKYLRGIREAVTDAEASASW